MQQYNGGRKLQIRNAVSYFVVLDLPIYGRDEREREREGASVYVRMYRFRSIFFIF